jgi:hypothetical protein
VAIGSGPNGLAAAIVRARANHAVTVYQGAPTIHVRFSRRLKVSERRPISTIMDVMNAALGGMQIAQSSFERTAQRIAGASTRPLDRPPDQPPDSVDLSTQMVVLLAARNQFQANAQVFQAGDKMEKKLLDILA